MTQKIELPKRRRLLGVMGTAGFAALAGCGSGGDSGDDSDDQDAQFEVTITSTNQPVADGALLEVTALVENVGEAEATDEVQFTVGDLERSSSLTLGPGDQEEITFEGRLQIDQAEQSFDAAVETVSGSDSTEITVFRESFFEVELESITDDLVAGELFQATARVENAGGEETTKTVRLDVIGLEDDPEAVDVTLGGGESTTVTLEWDTTDAVWADEVVVETGDESVSREISVREDAIVNFTIGDVNTPLVGGETLNVEAVVTNESGVEDTVTVTLDVPGIEDEVDSMDVTVGAEQTRSVTLNWVANDTAANEVRVRMRDQEDTREILVRKPANFNYTVQGVSDSVYPGETVEVDVLVENTGEVEGTTEVTLTGPDETTDTQSVTLPGYIQQTVTLGWTPGVDFVGTQDLTVEFEDSSEPVSTTVEYPLELTESTLVQTDEFWAEQGEITVRNSAPVAFTDVIVGELEIEETFTTRRAVTVPGDTEQTYSLKIIHEQTPISSQDATGSIDARIDRDAESVPEPADYERLILVRGTQDFTGSTLTIDCEVENPTTQPATGTVVAEVTVEDPSGDTERFADTREVTLAPDQSQTFQLQVEFESGADDVVFWSVGFQGIAEMFNLQ